jgi:hypothetical protein
MREVEAESLDLFSGLEGAHRPALAELAVVKVESQPALMQTLAARPVRVDSALLGVMARKRPACMWRFNPVIEEGRL